MLNPKTAFTVSLYACINKIDVVHHLVYQKLISSNICENSLIRLMEIILINYAYSIILVVNADILVFIVHFFSCLG